jgi:hypothetical protein
MKPDMAWPNLDKWSAIDAWLKAEDVSICRSDAGSRRQVSNNL